MDDAWRLPSVEPSTNSVCCTMHTINFHIFLSFFASPSSPSSILIAGNNRRRRCRRNQKVVLSARRRQVYDYYERSLIRQLPVVVCIGKEANIIMMWRSTCTFNGRHVKAKINRIHFSNERTNDRIIIIKKS